MSSLINLATSTTATFLRGAAGHRVITHGRQPAIALELYEFEACPHCRRVREALSAMDLDVVIYPCSKNSRHRETVSRLGGKLQFPFLVDRAHETKMYESSHIVRYLAKTYGHDKELWQHKLGKLSQTTSMAASMVRGRRGMRARGKWTEAEALELWSYEASPYCRIVRETLSELELPYQLHNLARGSSKRAAFKKAFGKIQVPYLKDKNTGKALFESRDIVAYLNATYASA